MKFINHKENYFYFAFEKPDYKKHGYLNCRRFLNAMQKEIPGGKNGSRYWIKSIKMWAIKKNEREKFNRLLKQYLHITYQKGIFDGY